MILGYKHVSSVATGPELPVEERVGSRESKQSNNGKTGENQNDQNKSMSHNTDDSNTMADEDQATHNKISMAVTWTKVIAKKRHQKRVF